MATGVVETKQPARAPATIRQTLESDAFKIAVAKVLPKHVTPERMARVAITALTRNPKLAECDQASFFRCLMDLSAWGLEPDGRRAHLIPFENRKAGIVECQLILDYKGIVELCYRSGMVEAIHADVIREGDLIGYDMGAITRHVPYWLRTDAGKPETAGNVIGAYCTIQLKGGVIKTEAMSREDIEAVRKRSKSANNGPWVTDWSEMAKKTVFRRASKWIPLSAEIRDAVENDDDSIDVQPEPVRRKSIGLDDLTERLTVAPVASDDSGSAKALAEFSATLDGCKTSDDVRKAVLAFVTEWESDQEIADKAVELADQRKTELEG